MRILVVSDIHANWAALAAIDEPFDVCLCLGDLVDYGPDPLPCVRWAMSMRPMRSGATTTMAWPRAFRSPARRGSAI